MTAAAAGVSTTATSATTTPGMTATPAGPTKVSAATSGIRMSATAGPAAGVRAALPATSATGRTSTRSPSRKCGSRRS